VPARPERPGPVYALTRAKRTAGLIAVTIVLATARTAAANDRLAVLVVVAGEPDLSDNLTEVAISRLARRGDRLLVGLREVRESLGDILDGSGIGGCVEQPACLARVGAATRAESALIGDVRRETGQFAVRLSLVNTRTAVREAKFDATVPADTPQLIAAIRTGVASLFEPEVATPVAAGTGGPADPAPGPRPQPRLPLPADRDSTMPAPSLLLPREEKPARRSGWLTTAAYGAGGLAVVALSAALVIGRDATAAPIGANRPEAERDLERREHDADIANGLYVAAGALAIAACAALLWRWRHE
jgi:hypothetical protein